MTGHCLLKQLTYREGIGQTAADLLLRGKACTAHKILSLRSDVVTKRYVAYMCMCLFDCTVKTQFTLSGQGENQGEFGLLVPV